MRSQDWILDHKVLWAVRSVVNVIAPDAYLPQCRIVQPEERVWSVDSSISNVVEIRISEETHTTDCGLCEYCKGCFRLAGPNHFFDFNRNCQTCACCSCYGLLYAHPSPDKSATFNIASSRE